jgi:8-oxo-dGTP pyrophosphatase MutT (NUDIX family)
MTFDMTPTPDSKKGMYDGKSLTELTMERNRLKSKMQKFEMQGKRISHEMKAELARLSFAIRAKTGWGKIEETSDYDAVKKPEQKMINASSHDFKAGSRPDLRITNNYADNPLVLDEDSETAGSRPDLRITNNYADNPLVLDEDSETRSQAKRLHALLKKAGYSDKAISGGITLSKVGKEKIAARFGISAKDVETVMATLIAELRDDQDEHPLPETDDRYSFERDALGNVAIHDRKTGKQAYARGSDVKVLPVDAVDEAALPAARGGITKDQEHMLTKLSPRDLAAEFGDKNVYPDSILRIIANKQGKPHNYYVDLRNTGLQVLAAERKREKTDFVNGNYRVSDKEFAKQLGHKSQPQLRSQFQSDFVNAQKNDPYYIKAKRGQAHMGNREVGLLDRLSKLFKEGENATDAETDEVDEGWKSAAVAATMMGSMALGSGHAKADDTSHLNATVKAPAHTMQADGSSYPTNAPVGTKFGSFKDANGRVINKYVDHDLTTHFKPADEGEWEPQSFPTNAPVGTLYGSFFKDGVKINKYVGYDLTPVFKPASEGPWKPSAKPVHEADETRFSVRLKDDSKAREWIKKVYSLYPGTWENNHVMIWGEGDDQKLVMFELVPSKVSTDTVEIKWFSSYPHRQGVGSHGMAELQRLAKEDGMHLTLYPWSKGTVSQSALKKFYKKAGFSPISKGGLTMKWSPVTEDSDRDHQDALDKTGFWGKAGAGCLVFSKETGRFLLNHRSRSVEQPGTWGTWGGAIDTDENPAQAVVRELQEEAGYHGPVSKVVPLYVYRNGSFSYFNFLVIVDAEFNPKTNWESQGFQWCKMGEWPSPLHFGLKDLLTDRQSLATMQSFVDEFAPLDESAEDFDDGMDLRGGTYNFPWKLVGKSGFATASFSGHGSSMKVKVISVTDKNGDDMKLDDSEMVRLERQAKDFIGRE